MKWYRQLDGCTFPPSFPTRGAWIEILGMDLAYTPDALSFPTRGAWIEIGMKSILGILAMVVPHPGSVD
nr:hypothetical protein [Clostridium minihomine]